MLALLNATPPTILAWESARVIVWVIVAFKKEKIFFYLKEATITQTITLADFHAKMVGGVAFKKGNNNPNNNPGGFPC